MEDEALLRALYKISGLGSYFSEGNFPFVFPGIRLPSGNEIAFPLPPSQVEEIRECAEPAPYGMGEETKLDDSVRKCWQLDASELVWKNPQWSGTIQKFADLVAGELGVSGKVIAEPYKLLLYEVGGHFLPHRDTEKIPGMFGSLIVNLPSAFTGGELVIRHDDREEIVDFSKGESAHKIRYAEFFADCEHEVRPVTSGYRLCLAYHLAKTKTTGKIPDPSPSGDLEPLAKSLQELRTTRGEELIAILLDHQYSEKSFSVKNLKGHDQARAWSLFQAAEKSGYIAHLGLVTLHQMGELEDAYPRRRRHWDDDFDDDPDSGTMGEIYEESLFLADWRTTDDKPAQLGPFSLSEEEIISVNQLGEGEPDEQFAEGFTGNAGCTMDYWYRRAAVVLWPEEAHHQILAHYNFSRAAVTFLDQAQQKGGAHHRSNLELGKALVGEVQSKFASVESEYALRSFFQISLNVFRGIASGKYDELYQKCSPKIRDGWLEYADEKLLKELIRAFGTESIKPLLEKSEGKELASHVVQAVFHLLKAAVSRKESGESFGGGLVRRLPEILEAEYRNPHSRRNPYRDDKSLTLIEKWHLGIASSFLIADDEESQNLKGTLWQNGSLEAIREVLRPALVMKSDRRHFSKPGSLFPELLQDTIDVLETEIGRELTPYPDWSRPVSDGIDETIVDRGRRSSIDFAAELIQFMGDPDREKIEFRCREELRSRIQSFGERHRFDLRYETRAGGTPYTLICRKTDASHLRDLGQRKKDKALLSELKKAQIPQKIVDDSSP